MENEKRKEKQRTYHAKYYAENKEKSKARSAKWQAENPEKVKSVCAKWYARNREKIKARSAKYHVENREKIKAQKAKLYVKNKEKYGAEIKEAAHVRHITHKYGISIHGYNEIFANQQGKCAICGTHQKDLKKKLYIDHNHTTGKVRALLCVLCNIVLGCSKESTDILENAINYLNYHTATWMQDKTLEGRKVENEQ